MYINSQFFLAIILVVEGSEILIKTWDFQYKFGHQMARERIVHAWYYEWRSLFPPPEKIKLEEVISILQTEDLT